MNFKGNLEENGWIPPDLMFYVGAKHSVNQLIFLPDVPNALPSPVLDTCDIGSVFFCARWYFKN
jgi:hypothetical protein